MKHVIVFNQIDTTYHGGMNYENEQLFNYLRAQIDWSIQLGWKKEDIIIGTNFDFEYNGVKNYQLTDVCTYSGYNNFWYGALELMQNGVLNEDYWLHDQDSWPVRKFSFPKFNGEIAGCEYQATPYWNCSTIYLKKTSQFLLEYIVELMRDNPNAPVSSDEEWIIFCRSHEQSEVKEYFSSLDTRYNCGFTHFDLRYKNATKPINVYGFKPDLERDYSVFKDHLSDDMVNIFKKHRLL